MITTRNLDWNETIGGFCDIPQEMDDDLSTAETALENITMSRDKIATAFGNAPEQRESLALLDKQIGEIREWIFQLLIK